MSELEKKECNHQYCYIQNNPWHDRVGDYIDYIFMCHECGNIKKLTLNN